MKSQNENPVYSAFPHLARDDGRYLAEHINIFWNISPTGGVCDVEVVFIPRGGLIHRDDAGLTLWENYAAYVARWTEDLGNSCEGWMEPMGLTPAQIFGHLLRLGFADQAELIAGLREFGAIVEGEWARDMLSSFIDEEEVPVGRG